MTAEAMPRTKVQAATLLLEHREQLGVTWKELAAVEGWGHGSTSRVLSDLHRTGHAARLTEKRDRCAVYVLPVYVGDRETEPFGQPKQPAEALALAAIQAEAALVRQSAAVEAIIDRYGLDASRFPTLRVLAAELRGALERPAPDDAPMLPY